MGKTSRSSTRNSSKLQTNTESNLTTKQISVFNDCSLKRTKMLTFEFIQHKEIKSMNTEKLIERIMTSVKENKIVLLECKLEPDERMKLIKRAIELVDNDFTGIELLVLNEDRERTISKILKTHIRNAMFLPERKKGMTIIGPSKIIKGMEHDFGKVHIHTKPQTKLE